MVIQKKHLHLYPLVDGSSLLVTPGRSTLFGCPSEILKRILIRKLPPPNTVVLPTKLYYGRLSQAAFEFVFFYYIFFCNGLEKHGPFRVFCTRSQKTRIREAMRNVFVGPTEEEMHNWGTPKEIAKELTKEFNYMAFRNPVTDLPYTVDEAIEWVILEVGDEEHLFAKKPHVSDIQIVRKSETQYNISRLNESVAIDISIQKEQPPPYDIVHKPIKQAQNQVSLTVMGASDGFDPYAPANGYLMNINHHLGIWDCPAYLHRHLEKLEIHFDQIEAIILTHVHEDHIDVVESIREGNPIDLYCTPEVYYALLLKVQMVIGCTEEEAKQYHNWHPLTVDKSYSIIGASFKFFYTVHAIPTVGSHITIETQNQKNKIMISSDLAPFWLMEDMRKEGFLSQERFYASTHLIKGDEDLVLMDAGGGVIHGNYKDYIDSDVHIEFMHTGELPLASDPKKHLIKHADILTLKDSSFKLN